ncbi:hypothetical protein ACL6C3_16385 [Capilliphycus salinus ALCB114379]|uniref:hypothetical protein n=1 Tax=Capilliphycus salinus TaxID=2768948 RepID=UPI0039A748D2
MGCFIRLTTAVTLIAGVQFTLVETAQARFQPEPRTNESNSSEVRSGDLDPVIGPFLQTAEEQPPNTNGTGGAR